VDRRIHAGEIPIASLHLAVRLHTPFAQEQVQLPLRKRRIDPRHRDHMKRHIHAANHGYSYPPGIEITSRANKCGQSEFRLSFLTAGGAGGSESPRGQTSTT
jgi:hypothetical protein